MTAVEPSPRYWAVTLGVLAAWLSVCAVSVGACGCAASQAVPETPRDQARAAIVLVAKGVLAASDACADHATRTKDIPLARRCADAYDVARPSLLSAEGAIDVYDSTKAGSIACATKGATLALLDITAALEAAGQPAPAVAVDAVEFVSRLVGPPCRSN